MTQTKDDTVGQLMRESDEFRQLKQDHSGLELRLDALAENPALSKQEKIEIAEIKKKKLILKDRMLQLTQAAVAS